MKREAKASSAGSTLGQASPHGSIRRALAAFSPSRDGSRRSVFSRRLFRIQVGAIALALALIALFGVGGALALQSHKTDADIDPSPANNGGVPNFGATGGFGGLSGLAIDPDGGDLYVVDITGAGTPVEGTGAVHRFDNTGKYLDTIDGTAVTQGSFSLGDPTDVAVDSSGTGSDGNFYVTDPGNNLVNAFDSSGVPVVTFGDTEPAADGQLHGVDTTAGSFGGPCGLAVDQSTGNLYVADQGNSRIWIFDSSGKYLDRISDSSLQGPCGLAFTSTGDLYVRNAFTANVVKFHKVGPIDFDFHSILDSNNATDVAVDTTDDHVYVDNGTQITEYDSEGSQISTFGQGLSGSNGLAVDGAVSKIYAVDAGVFPPMVRTFGPLVTLPEAATGVASKITDTTATIAGSIDPAGGPEAGCSFEYGIDTTYGSSVPCSPEGPFASPADVSAELLGLSATTTYHYRLHTSNPDGTTNGPDRTFTTLGPPVIGNFSVSGGDTTATLKAQINPNGYSTSYHFEYGMTESYGTNLPVPDGTIGSGTVPVDVSTFIENLSPGTTYHFRVVAENKVDSVESADFTFTTDSLLPPDTCPNAKLRADQGTSWLPNCRAYEIVNTPDKGNQPVFPVAAFLFPANNNLAMTADGNTALWSVPSGAPGSTTASMPLYRAVRTSSGWESTAVVPPAAEQFGEGEQVYNMLAATRDLTSFLFRVSEGRSAGESSLTLVRVDLTGHQEVLGTIADPTGVPVEDFDTTADLAHVLQIDRTDKEDGGIYDYGNGTPELVSIFPDGSPGCGVERFYEGDRLYHFIATTDASRVYFESTDETCSGPINLYVRNRDNSTTTLIAPEGTFVRASADGRTAIYVAGGDIYRYEENVGSVCLTCATGPAHTDPSHLIVSKDLEHIYFTSSTLAPGENLYQWSKGSVQLVSPISIGGFTLDPVRTYLSDDGEVLSFLSEPAAIGTGDPGGKQQLYRYDEDDGSVVCVSCRPDGQATKYEVQLFNGMSGDGSTVAFLTRSPLNGRDINDDFDIYQWRDGDVHLITDGLTKWPSIVLARPALKAISQDGSDILFSVTGGLTGVEADQMTNLYDAKINGGYLIKRAPAPCQEDACQGPLVAPPALNAPGSASFQGARNVKAHAKRHGHRKKRRHGHRKHGKKANSRSRMVGK